jgi:1,4-dihydroxy-2-naphthoate octaprenyltransferase
MSLPLQLAGGVLLTGIGAAIARYLAHPVRPGVFLLGQALIALIQLTGHYLLAYHNSSPEVGQGPAGLLSLRTGALGPDGLPRKVAQIAAICSGGLAAIVATGMLIQGLIPPLGWLLVGLIWAVYFLYSVPPGALERTGYGEALLSIGVAGLLPAFGYALQTGETHRQVLMASTPLIALHICWLMTCELEDFLVDTQRGKRTLLVRLGWLTGMRLHDLALVMAAVAFLLGYLNGLPVRVAAGATIVLPLGLAQMWQMSRIRGGAPPRWRVLLLTSEVLFGLTSYLVLVGFLQS